VPQAQQGPQATGLLVRTFGGGFLGDPGVVGVAGALRRSAPLGAARVGEAAIGSAGV